MNTIAHRDIGRPLDAALQAFDLPPLLEKIKSERDWTEQKRNAMTLHKSPGLKVVLVAMHAGTTIPEHRAGAPFSLLVVEGRVRFTADGRTTTLERGGLLTLHAGVAHSVEAAEESAFLLTLAGGS